MNLPKIIISFGLGYITGTLGIEILVFNNPRPNIIITFGLAMAVFALFLSGSYIEK